MLYVPNPEKSTWQKHYETEGPLGFPMTEKQARNLDVILKSLPKEKEYGYKKTTFHKASTEVSTGERADVSWISTETPDRYGHVVVAKGMSDAQFALNPIVTLNHNYSIPPIGKSLWRKFHKDGQTRGVKAKTVYPAKPDAWGDDAWPPDKVFTLIQAGLLNGKSIGWIPTKLHYADDAEMKLNSWKDDTLVIDNWLLIEYAVGTIPVNPETVVQIVSKCGTMEGTLLKALEWDEELFKVSPGGVKEGEKKTELPALVKFTPVSEIITAAQRAIEKIDVKEIVNDAVGKQFGRV